MTIPHANDNHFSRDTNPGAFTSARKPRRSGTIRFFAIGGLLATALTGALASGRLLNERREPSKDFADSPPADAPIRTMVAVAQRMPRQESRVLPGNSLPLLEAAIYARTTGYLKSRKVDIGERVVQGQLLAEIAAPDIDAQLAQAEANLVQARANLPLAEANAEMAKITLGRDTKSGAGTAVSWEQIDQDKAQVKVTAAQVASAQAAIQVNQAAVQRYSTLQGFQKIVAPFPGIITARNVDAGDLISADSPNATREMFHIMRTDALRVFVNVPQAFATGIKVGQTAQVFLRDDPKKLFSGRVTRTTDALDPNSRTLLTEVDVPNPDNVLRPGMYLQVSFVFDRDISPVMIPTAALTTRNGQQRVGVVDSRNRVRYRSVQLGRDFGAQVAVIAGLQGGETVVVHPGDEFAEGAGVDPVPTTD